MPLKASQGPDYSTLSYWQQRFSTTDQPFDWLNDGVDALLTPLSEYLDTLVSDAGTLCPAVPASFPPQHSDRTSESDDDAQEQEEQEPEQAQASSEKRTGQSTGTKGPAILHIGVGSSVLSLSLLNHYIRRGWDPRKIVNLDFAHSAVEAARELERGYWRRQRQEEGNKNVVRAQRHGQGNGEAQERESGYTGNFTCHEDEPQMSYVQADLLSWSSIRTALHQLHDSDGEPFCSEGFDAILDKSTTDAISTGEDHEFSSANLPTSSSGICPALLEFLRHLWQGKTRMHEVELSPVHVLSLNLSSLAKTACRWYVLSYSDSRFRDVLHLSDCESKSLWPWNVLSTKGIEAGGGAERTGDGRVVHTPIVYHWAYELGLND